MQHLSLRAINEEHASLSAVLQSIRMMLQRGPQGDRPAFFDVLSAMLFYIDEVPEKQHHRKESELLFPPLVQRSAHCAAVVHQLDQNTPKANWQCANCNTFYRLGNGWGIHGARHLKRPLWPTWTFTAATCTSKRP